MVKVNSSFQITEKLTRQLSEFIKLFHETILQLNFIPIQNVINFDYHIVSNLFASVFYIKKFLCYLILKSFIFCFQRFFILI